MKYCCTELERKGSCYHEFQQGKFRGEFWQKNSLLIHDDQLYELHLASLFKSVISYYNEYSETEVTEVQWNAIYRRALEVGGEVKLAIGEINTWAQENFKTEEVFTILGI